VAASSSPGCGTGNFIGLAPEHLPVSWIGVEKDPVTGRIARALHPQADFRIEGFEDTRVPSETFDLVIGNVPFGNFHLVDPLHNRARRKTGGSGIFEVCEFDR
jgi:predicted RNA methylase